MQCISGACSKVNEPIVLIEPISKPINIKWKKYMNITKVHSCSLLNWFLHKKILHSGKYCHDLRSLFLLNKKLSINPWPHIFYVWLKVLLFALHWFLTGFFMEIWGSGHYFLNPWLPGSSNFQQTNCLL